MRVDLLIDLLEIEFDQTDTIIYPQPHREYAMNRNDFKNPLIQSGLILIGVFLLMAIVVSSPASGFFSGIFAIVVAFFKGLLFLIGLTIAVVCSIAVLIGVFLLATSFYSTEKYRYFYSQIKDQCITLYCSVRGCTDKREKDEKVEVSPVSVLSAVEEEEESGLKTQKSISSIETRIRNLESGNKDLKNDLNKATELISSLSGAIDDIKQTLSSAQKTGKNHDTPVSPERLENLETQLNEISDKVEQAKKSVDNQVQAVQKELTELKGKCSVPEMISGILSYIDSPEDREKLNETAEEAVSRGMTYSQADELFKKNLPPKIYKTLNAHPRLTKDFIRSIKKKFA